ncbi:MAG: leucine-rich repeat domain-containing protein [Clostridiales bacterium]|nr:leucine-rich repeat domain-containing protein [Clostridiales bacterium]
MAVTIILLLLAPLSLLAWGFCLPSCYEETFLGELKDKCALLEEETEQPRIILVGGSAVAFGVDSALIEAQLPGYTVVNFGMYAALGTTVMLDLSQESLREGDIVLLIPEQQEQTLSDYFDASILWQGLDGAFSLLARLDSDRWGQLAGTFPAFAAQKLAWTVTGTGPEPEGVYTHASFNKYGDVVSDLCTQNVMSGLYDGNTPIRFSSDIPTEEFVEAVNDYAAAAQARGATVWYYFCPMNTLAVEEGADVDGWTETLQTLLDIPVVGDPNNSILEAEWFYDTNFHLNASGKTVYTRQLIRDIKAMLGDSSPTEIDLPDQPQPVDAALTEGDDSDADCFLYESDGETVTVTGLSEAGQRRTSLTVPTQWEGLPVTAIAGSAFAGETGLVELTIQDNITTIGNLAFDGCTALERIVVENDDPSSCRVGQQLLDGTEASIYVSQAVLSDYRTNYFWSVYGARIVGE